MAKDVRDLMERASAVVRKRWPAAMVERASTDLERPGLWASTGAAVLDRAIAGSLPGGVPMGPKRGRTIHIYGDPSMGKSLLLDEIIKSTLALGGIALVSETEGSRDPHYAKAIGLDLSLVEIQRPDNVLALFDEGIAWIENLRKGGFAGPVLWGLDSLEMTASSVLAGKPLAETSSAYGGKRPEEIGRGCREVARLIKRQPTTFVILNQVRENPTVMFGDKKTKPGGKAVPFFASAEIFLRRSKFGLVRDARNKVLSQWVHFKVEKNKLAPPFVEGDFLITFARGVNRWAGLPEMLEQDGLIALERKGDELGKGFTVTATGEVLPLVRFGRWAAEQTL